MIRDIVTYFIFLGFIAGFFTSCDLPDDPGLPDWDVDLNLPLTQKHYTLEDILDESEYLRIDTMNGRRIYGIVSDTIKKENLITDFFKGRLKGRVSENTIVEGGKFSYYINMPNDEKIDTAYINKGYFRFKIDNTSLEFIRGKIIIPAFKDAAGNYFETNYQVESGDLFNEAVDISGYRFKNPDYQNSGNQIEIILESLSSSSGKQVSITFEFENVELSYMQGEPGSFMIDNISGSVRMPDFDGITDLHQIKFKNPYLWVETDYETGIDKNLIFNTKLYESVITGKKYSGSEFQLTETGNPVLNELILYKGEIKKEFSKNNSNLADFISFLPDSISLKTNLNLNYDNEYGAASITDKLITSVWFYSPASLELDSLLLKDTAALDISQDIRDELTNTSYAIIEIKAENGIPANVLLEMSIGTVDSVFFIKNAEIPAASFTENVDVMPAVHNIEIELSQSDINYLIKSDKLFFNIYIDNSSISEEYFFSPDDYISIDSKINIKYNIVN